MLSHQRDVVASIARTAAASGQPLEEALAAHLSELAPLIDRGVTALEIVQASEEEHSDMERWMAARRRRMAV